MSSIFPRKVICPHCGATNLTWGWSEKGVCADCRKDYEVALLDIAKGESEKKENKR